MGDDGSRSNKEDLMRKRFRERHLARNEGMGDKQPPRLIRGLTTYVSKAYIVLPLSTFFAGCCVYYTMKQSFDRTPGACVNCERQREMAEEVYGLKRSKSSNAARQLP